MTSRVVIPASDLSRALAEARSIEAEDMVFAEQIRAERPGTPHRGDT